jgi:hypothetical protein
MVMDIFFERKGRRGHAKVAKENLEYLFATFAKPLRP